MLYIIYIYIYIYSPTTELRTGQVSIWSSWINIVLQWLNSKVLTLSRLPRALAYGVCDIEGLGQILNLIALRQLEGVMILESLWHCTRLVQPATWNNCGWNAADWRDQHSVDLLVMLSVLDTVYNFLGVLCQARWWCGLRCVFCQWPSPPLA